MKTYTSAVEIDHLRKTYGTLVAVDDVSVSVAEGEIFGILGPNGAGKTTAIECAIGLREPDAGTVRLLGLDPRADQAEIHQIVGVQLQASAFPAKLRVGEILDMYRSFYRHPADVSELTGALGLAGKHGDYYRSLSGGQRQRLSVALALIGRPRLAFLDEMTTGLDPQARRDAWELIERVRESGVTVILVTHFMEEAERLCDRVALIDRGRVVALDAPDRLAAQARGGKTVQFVPSAPFDDRLLTGLPEVGGVGRQGQHVLVTGTGDLVNAVILALPTVLLVVFSLIPTFRQLQASLGGFSPLGVYVPILIGFSLAMLALFGLPIPLVSYRELGVLRRLSATPVPPSWLLAAQGAVQLGVLRDVSDYIPLGAAVEAIQDSMRGPFPPAAPLLVLTGYAVLFGFLAARFFRWE